MQFRKIKSTGKCCGSGRIVNILLDPNGHLGPADPELYRIPFNQSKVKPYTFIKNFSLCIAQRVKNDYTYDAGTKKL
jgi:hypothetical protein